MNLDAVATVLAGEPAYRMRELWDWTARGAAAFAAMTNLTAVPRRRLPE